MRAVCITILGSERSELARRHFSERGVEAQFFYGLSAAKLGVATTLTYEVDHPGSGYRMGPSPTGCWLSHRALWAALALLPDDLFLVLEDDAQFPPDWRARLDRAVADAGDFDLLYVGSCCAGGKPQRHIAGAVYEVRWPFCTHGYVVRRSALKTIIDTQDAARVYAPVDLSLAFHTLAHIKTRVVLPRLLDQFNTEIPP